MRLAITRYHQTTYGCICVYMCALLQTYDKISSTDTSSNNHIDFLLHSCQKKNKQTNNQTKNIHSGGSWKLISSVVQPQQEWLYWNPQKSHFGHQLINPTISVTIFNWYPYLQLQNAKLNLSNYTVASPFNREINYTCTSQHSCLE